MSQLTLTPDEDKVVADALRAKATAYTAMFGSIDPALEVLIAKVEGQLPTAVVQTPEVVAQPVEETIVEEEPAEETPDKE